VTQPVQAALRTAASRLLQPVPVALWRRLLPKSVLGLCYHIVSDASVPHVRHYPILDTAAFAADLAYLARHFGFLSYDALVQRRGSANPVRDTAALVTFDDGFAECATVAAPLLRRHGAGGVFFVITDLIDNAAVFRETEASLCIAAIGRLPAGQVEAIIRELGLAARLAPPPQRATSDAVRLPLDLAGLDDRPDRRLRPLLHWLLTVTAADAALLRQVSARLGVDPDAYVRTAQPYLTTAQIRQLRSDGFTIGAHSRGHHWLQGLSRAEAEQEIVESCRIVRDLTGQESVPFAFPYFGGGIDRAWLAQLRRAHPFIGLLFDTDGLRADAPFVVQRVFGERIGADRTLDAILRRAWARPAAWRR
jgi:peptidoglycan/xylan/chitin deacetylase (PgdA/CDA1 family)